MLKDTPRYPRIVTDATVPRTARPSYVLGLVSLFIPILVIILLPTIDQVILLVVQNLAVAAALAALILGLLTIRATAGGARPGRVTGVFGVLLAVVSLVYNVPTLVGVMQLVR